MPSQSAYGTHTHKPALTSIFPCTSLNDPSSSGVWCSASDAAVRQQENTACWAVNPHCLNEFFTYNNKILVCRYLAFNFSISGSTSTEGFGLSWVFCCRNKYTFSKITWTVMLFPRVDFPPVIFSWMLP